VTLPETCPTILYIGGMGRSGSTLLEYLLGRLDGYFPAGEVKFVWSNGLIRNELCSCGSPFLECPFWTAVGEKAFGGWASVDPRAMQDLATASTTTASILRLLGNRQQPSPALHRYSSVLVRLYGAIQAVSGARVIVDASKTPVELLVLARTRGLQCRLLHLVRDSRGVVFSWAKRGIRLPQVAGETETMLTYGAFHTSPRWVYANLFFECLRQIVPSAQIRYEALAREPRTVIEEALRRCGAPLDCVGLEGLADGSVATASAHTLGGNPMRFRAGDQRVAPDEAWKQSLGRRDRYVATILTLPLLLRYRYPLGASPSS
jgi:hypothetical protein